MMIRTFKLNHRINAKKQNTILSVLKQYRILCDKISNRQWFLFFYEGHLDKQDINIKTISSPLSQRYRQTAQYQVVSQLKSFLSNRQNDFRKIVSHSSLSDTDKHILHSINKYQAWFSKSFSFKKEPVPSYLLKLARCIFRELLKRNRKPSFCRSNMNLDAKVAKISSKEPNKANSFDFWIKLSTLVPHKPIEIPINTHKFYNESRGTRKEFCQINADKNNTISICFMKEQEPLDYHPKTSKISIDFGLRVLMTTNRGDLFGRNLLDVLKYYDKQLTELDSKRRSLGLSVRTGKHNRIVDYVRNLLKQEVCRTINRIISLYAPREFVVENLDFSHPNLSRSLNRILQNCGRSLTESKLKQVSEDYGIIITHVHAAYSSKTCNHCGYVDEYNRKEQSTFKCKLCGYSLNADVHSARAHLKRSSCSGYEVGKSKKEVLHVVWEDFFHKRVEKQKGFYSETSLLELLKKNRYFQEWIRSAAAGNEMIYNSFNSKGFVGGSSLSAFDKIP